MEQVGAKGVGGEKYEREMHSFMHCPDHSTPPWTDILVCSHIHVVKINKLFYKTLNKTFKCL